MKSSKSILFFNNKPIDNLTQIMKAYQTMKTKIQMKNKKMFIF